MANTVETRTFQAETRALLDLMIHSLYTQKEIFLRELVSNASDALDRLRFEALTRPELLAGDEELEIHIETDREGRTLTIRDNGIGMSRDEVITNIGTIAKSGSRELMEQIRTSKSPTEVEDLIGQFGVGFYSSFMAADQVSLTTRRAGEKTATHWNSDGTGEYTLAEGARASRGTTVVLHLKEVDRDGGIEDFTEDYTVSRVVKRYSDFVAYPIILTAEHDEIAQDEHGMPTDGGKSKTVIEKKTLNSMKPIWTRIQSEVKDEEYAEFYKHISHDWTPPATTLRFEAEGRIEYQVLVFVPEEAAQELYYHAYEFGLQLYVRKVMIMERCEDLLPRYLRFLKGVVDSADLPLNISRQRLQEDRHITQIRKWTTRKVLDSFQELQKNDAERYLKFWEQFGRAMKEGLTADFDNKDRLLPLMLFQSSSDPEKLTTLAEYKERMNEGQNEIYYLTGESRATVESSPHLESFKAKGYEVLYLVDTVDELLVQYLHEFDGTRLKSVGKGTVELGSEEEKKKAEEESKTKEEELKNLMELMQKKLDAEIKQVRLSGRLTESPACLVGAEHDYSPQMEKLLMKGKGGGAKQRWILELNPGHPIVAKMQERFTADKDDALLGDYAELLLGYAQLAEGSELTDAVRFNQVLTEVMTARID
jgi:molecular chaperone HtpG